MFPTSQGLSVLRKRESKGPPRITEKQTRKRWVKGGKKEKKKRRKIKKTLGASDVSELLQTGDRLQEMDGCMCQGKE